MSNTDLVKSFAAVQENSRNKFVIVNLVNVTDAMIIIVTIIIAVHYYYYYNQACIITVIL